MSKNNVKILVDGDILGQKGGHSEGPGILCPAEVESGSLNVLGFITDDLAKVLLHFGNVPSLGLRFQAEVGFNDRFADNFIMILFQDVEETLIVAASVIDMGNPGRSNPNSPGERFAVAGLAGMEAGEIPKGVARQSVHHISTKDVLPIVSHLLVAQA